MTVCKLVRWRQSSSILTFTCPCVVTTEHAEAGSRLWSGPVLRAPSHLSSAAPHPKHRQEWGSCDSPTIRSPWFTRVPEAPPSHQCSLLNHLWNSPAGGPDFPGHFPCREKRQSRSRAQNHLSSAPSGRQLGYRERGRTCWLSLPASDGLALSVPSLQRGRQPGLNPHRVLSRTDVPKAPSALLLAFMFLRISCDSANLQESRWRVIVQGSRTGTLETWSRFIFHGGSCNCTTHWLKHCGTCNPVKKKIKKSKNNPKPDRFNCSQTTVGLNKKWNVFVTWLSSWGGI